MRKSRYSKYHEPNMSDSALLVTVEDLINIAMGPETKNVVNFKLIQQVLHILARQMRMLEQKVEIKVTEFETSRKSRESSENREVKTGRSPRKPSVSKQVTSGITEPEKGGRVAQNEREKAERVQSRDQEKEEKTKSKAAKIEQSEREKDERAAPKEKAERDGSKQREKKEKDERAESKGRDKADREKGKDNRDKIGVEKEQQTAEREREKAEYEMVKAGKAESKEKEKAERTSSKERGKADKASKKEREKSEKASDVEQERADRDAAKFELKDRDREGKELALDKLAQKEKDKAEKEQTRFETEKFKAQREKERMGKHKGVKDKDGLSIQAEKGPTTRFDSRTSIEVVTQSKFEILKLAVQELQEKAKPLPPLALPDNKKLREDIAKGSASLTETMQAMKVDARVQAAESAINRMSELLTQLALAGALPEDVAGKISEMTASTTVPAKGGDRGGVVKDKSKAAMAARKSVAISAKPGTTDAEAGHQTTDDILTSKVSKRKSIASVASRLSTGPIPGVVHEEMENSLKALRDELTRNMNVLMTKAASVADNALTTAKSVAEKLDVALKVNTRISTLNTLVVDYAEQLNGFDTGIATQMQSFKEQMLQMRSDLKGGLGLLENVNNNAETAAVRELNERYEGLVSELDNTMHTHQALTSFQSQLGEELRALVECVENLREQKADRDEVADGLRDKADSSRLAGLMTEADFEVVREQLENRLDVCHDKFNKQENMWIRALNDLADISHGKADLLDLMGMREDAQSSLRDLNEKLAKLALILGEPTAAILTRKLSKGGVCGACSVPALMRPGEPPVPPVLPALRPSPQGAEEPCLQQFTEPDDDRSHICQRWVGGSHTLVTAGVVTHQVAPPFTLPHATPTTKYTGKGLDGRLYKMEVEMQPCKECNLLSSEMVPEGAAPTPADGSGDKDIAGDTTSIDVTLQ